MITITLILFTICFNLAAAEPFYAADDIPVAPIVDGRIDDECWQKVESTSMFVQVNGEPSPIKTTAKMLINDGNLYVGFFCGEMANTNLKELLRKKSITEFEDSVEFFLEPEKGNGNYYQFMFSVTGKKYTGIGGTRKVELDSHWIANVAVKEDHWSAEFKIQLVKFGIKPDIITLCGLNLNRTCILNKKPYSCWAPTYGGFQNSSRFGNLIFCSYSRWLRNRLSSQTEHFKQEILQLKKKYPESLKFLIKEALHLLEISNKKINSLKGKDIKKSEKFRKLYFEAVKFENAFSEMLAQIRLNIINKEYIK